MPDTGFSKWILKELICYRQDWEKKDSAENESLLDIDNDDSDEDNNSGSESSSDEEDVILAFIDDDEEVAFIDDEEVERPATTRSGRAITRRSEIDFSFFFFWLFNEYKVYSELTHFSFADLVQLKVANATVVLIVISWYCQKDGFVNCTVCIADLIEFSFFSFAGGLVTRKNLPLLGGGPMVKNLLTEGGPCNFLMTVKQIPPSPPPPPTS